MKKFVLSCMAAVLLMGNARAQDMETRKTVAVMPTIGTVNEDLRGAVQDALKEGVSNSDMYTLGGREADFERALKEFNFQNSGAVNDSQMKEFGKAVSADFVCYANIRKLGNNYRISYSMLNVASSRIPNVKSKSTENGDHDLIKVLDAIAVDLFGGQTGGGHNASNSRNNTTKPSGNHRNGETWSPDGIDMVYVEGTGTGIFAVKGFYIGKYEVTQAQWQAIMGSNPSNFKGGNNPVEKVSWNDVQEFIKRLNAATGRNYALPTEAQWEYAAREGKNSSYEYSGSNNINSVAWYDGNSGSTTHPVGQKSPNALGIYDMTGNVWEWCQDCYDSSCSYRVYRGGGWGYDARYCRVASRFNNPPSHSNYFIGFRLVIP